MTEQHTDEDEEKQSFWRSLPGILTGVTGIIGAIGALFLTLQQAGALGSPSAKTSPSPATSTSAGPVASPPNPPLPTPSAPVPTAGPLPDTDAQGWLDSRARCDPGQPAAAMGRTTQSLLVVCQSGPGTYYYRGVRLNDDAFIELANAVHSSSGFDVIHPDGTRYEIGPNQLTIVQPNGQQFEEPMKRYWSA